MQKITAAHRTLNVLVALKGHSLNGLSNSELAQGLNETPVNITRALAVLQDVGLVTKLETGRFVLSITMLQIAQAHANEVDRAQNRIMELNQRVAAGAAAYN